MSLAHLGFSDDEALRKQVLFDLVLDTLRAVSAGPPEYAVWVPGRLEIFGKHTDYGGGHTLVAPVPRGFVLAARARHDGDVCLHDVSRREHFLIASERGVEPDETPRAMSDGAPRAMTALGAVAQRAKAALPAAARTAKTALDAVAQSAKVAGGGMR